MEIQFSDLDNNIRLIKLIGKLDAAGVKAIETQFADHSAGEKLKVVVDLSTVEFLASPGIQLLTGNAKSITSRGGRMVLVSPLPAIRGVLEVTGISSIIPMYDGLEAAKAGLLAN